MFFEKNYIAKKQNSLDDIAAYKQKKNDFAIINKSCKRFI